MEDILELFSANSWLLVRTDKVDEFVKKFGLELYSNTFNWQDSETVSFEDSPVTTSNILTYNASKIVITSEINGYCIVESKSVNYLFKEFCENLSINSDTYRFLIDIWVPEMLFEYYKNGNLVRRVEYDLDESSQAVTVNEEGQKLDFESENLAMQFTDYNYGEFYFPLSIMNYLGISVSDIRKMLKTNCSIFRLGKEFINLIFKKTN